MIQDYQTNMVYLARGLSHYGQVCRNLLEALHREQIHAEFLPYTSSYKHVWVRDYMPIQLEKTLFFLYQYWPDYLLGYDGYIPDILKIIKHLELDRIYTMNNSKIQSMVIIDNLHHGRIPKEIFLDGGNFVKCGDKVLMTDKIFNGWRGKICYQLWRIICRSRLSSFPGTAMKFLAIQTGWCSGLRGIAS